MIAKAIPTIPAHWRGLSQVLRKQIERDQTENRERNFFVHRIVVLEILGSILRIEKELFHVNLFNFQIYTFYF